MQKALKYITNIALFYIVIRRKKYRTKSFNGMLSLIFKETKYLQGYKKRESDSKNRSQTHLGCSGYLFSNRFAEDLERLWEMRNGSQTPVIRILIASKQVIIEIDNPPQLNEHIMPPHPDE